MEILKYFFIVNFVVCSRSQLEVLSVAELGVRFQQDHLRILTARCTGLELLDISSTVAAGDELRAAQFAGLTKLKTLAANMMVGLLSLISCETLLDFGVKIRI